MVDESFDKLYTKYLNLKKQSDTLINAGDTLINMGMRFGNRADKLLPDIYKVCPHPDDEVKVKQHKEIPCEDSISYYIITKLYCGICGKLLNTKTRKHFEIWGY